MVELLKTNDPVMLSYVRALLGEAGVGFFVADQHMSVLEGSIGILPQRVLVVEEDADRAREVLRRAGVQPAGEGAG